MVSKLKISLFSFCIALAGGVYAQQKVASKPNILFVMVDDLGYGDIGVFYQNLRKLSKDKSLPYQLTPELDKMAAGGAIFTDQYSNAPVCAPSRASFLTGMTQGNAHVRNNQFDKALENNHTVASVLKNAGYTTAAIGKWGLQGVGESGPNWSAHPLKRGFDYYYGYIRHVDGHEHYPYEGIYRGKKEVWENYNEVSNGLEKCYTTDLWTAAAKRWIINHQQAHSDNQPFMMFLAYDTPHAVLELPTQAYPEGKGLAGGLQWKGQKGNMINTASGVPDSYIHPDYQNATYDEDNNPNTNEKMWPDTYVRYATSVRRIDDAIGDIIALLEDLKIDQNTLIVFTSDNGPSMESYLPKQHVTNHPTFFGSYGPFDGIKRDVWEGGLRMPVIAYWPQQLKKGSVIAQPSMLSDWLPTFAEIAGLPIPARVDGKSLLPVLKNENKNLSRTVYVEYFEGGNTPNYPQFETSRRNKKRGEMQMIREGNMVGVRYNIKSAKDSFEIYNVVKDPKQIHNLAEGNKMSALQSHFLDLSLQLRKPDDDAVRIYDQAMVPALQKTPKSLKPGLNYQFFEGNFPFVASQIRQKVSESGVAAGLDNVNSKGMYTYSGYINVPEDGTYTFTFESACRAVLYIHGALAIDSDFQTDGIDDFVYKCNLAKGVHPIRLTILNLDNRKEKVGLSWQTDTGEKENCVSYFCR